MIAAAEKTDNDDGIEAGMFYAIVDEMERVWGEPGFSGEAREYKWLEENYGVTEEDDVNWQLALQYFVTHDLPEEDMEDPEVMDFLDDYNAVRAFLKGLLLKYRSSDKVFPRK